MATSIFQHKMTQMKIIAYAITGEEGEARVPDGKPATKATPEDEQKHREKALAQLTQLQGFVAQANPNGAAQAPVVKPKVRSDHTEATKALREALDGLPKPRGDK